MDEIRSIKSNFIYNAIYQLANIMIPLITTPFLTRVLRAEGLGKYSFAYSIAYYFYIFIRLGLNSYGNRTVAFVKDDKKELSKTFCSIYAFQLFMGIIVSLLYFLYAFWRAKDIEIALIFSLVVISGSFDFTWVMYGLEEFRITSIRDIMIKFAMAVGIFCFIHSEEDVWKYALIYSLGFFVSQVVVIPIVIKRIHFEIPSMSEVIVHIKPNLILFLPTIAVSLYKIMDRIMLGFISNEEELGFYYTCENIINVPLALIAALGTIMLPWVSNMLSKYGETNTISEVFDKSILFAMFVSTSICIGIMTVSKEFVALFFGAGYEKCNTLFLIILPSCIFLAFATVVRTQFLLPRKMDKVFIISLFLGAAINLLFNSILIPLYASVGAAVGTLAAEITVWAVQTASVYKAAAIGKNIRNSIPFIVSGIVMYFGCHNYVPRMGQSVIGLFEKIIISGCVYMICLILIILTIKRLSNVSITS